MTLACGIDVGGTKIAGGVVDDDGKVLAAVVSPQAAALASFSITTGRSRRGSSSPRRSTSRQARLGANSTVDLELST